MAPSVFTAPNPIEIPSTAAARAPAVGDRRIFEATAHRSAPAEKNVPSHRMWRYEVVVTPRSGAMIWPSVSTASASTDVMAGCRRAIGRENRVAAHR
ncbi:hypothetical protein [Sinomonas susongensis]|uniref:hypothetical protein n=1 Tax=Sinomonas susongensis TaxID=1324851 RepID=UPI0011080444|nr:hypothetical protein [Sinomonas susongensis]